MREKMRERPSLAVVGATGLVGSEMVAILEERKFPFSEIKLLASKDSAGELYKVAGNEFMVEELTESSFEGMDIALFAAGGSISERFAPLAVEAGTVVIDNSSFFRMHDEVPLVVPEVNGDAITNDTKLIANPNCSTIQLVPILDLLHKKANLERVVVSTYQAVSGAGKSALDELWEQTLAVCNQTSMPTDVFKQQIAFNCIPHIDVFEDSGYTKEELKIIHESRKILSIPDLRVTATAVRVPVFHSHAESVNVELGSALSVEDFVTLLNDADGIVAYPQSDNYPLQLAVAGGDDIHVGRIRRDDSVANGLSFWVVADNVRKGAALNAVQIAELLIK